MAIKKARNKPQPSQQADSDVEDVEIEETVDDDANSADDDAEQGTEEPDDEADGEEQSDELTPEQRIAKAYETRFPGAPKGAVFEAGENIIVKAHTQGDLIVVDEPVYRATKPPGSRRWRFHLLYSKGASMAKAKTKKIGKQTGEDKKTVWPYEVKDSGYFSA